MASLNLKTETTLFSSPVLEKLKTELERKRVKVEEPSVERQLPKCRKKKLQIGNPEVFAQEKLRKYAYQTPPGILDKRTVKRIRKYLPLALTETFPSLIDTLFAELHTEFGNCIRDTAAEQKIKPSLTMPSIIPDRDTEKYFQKTYTATEFQDIKDTLRPQLFITTPLLRAIHKKTVLKFPDSLINYASYREQNKSIQLAVLRARIREDLDAEKYNTITAVCREVFTLIRSGKFLRSIEQQFWMEYMEAIRFFLRLRIMELLHRTTEHFVKTLSDTGKTPLLQFKISLSDSIDMSPTIKQITTFYHTMIDTMGMHLLEIPPMTKISLSPQYRKVLIELPSYLSEWAHQQVDFHLRINLEPLQQYLDEIDKDYSILWDKTFIEEMTTYDVQQHTFSECCLKVKFLYGFKKRISVMLPNKYFQIGIVSQTDMIETLLHRMSIYMENLLRQLVAKNYQENLKICDEFATITAKATKIPTNTQELVTMATYMAWAKTKHISELQDHAVESLLQVTELIELTTITEKHIKLNADTLVWSAKITSIVEENTAMYEQRKNELEEDLQRHIDDLTRSVQQFMINLQILDDMSDCDKAGSYIYYLKKMTLGMEEFDVNQKWINKEETLFKFPMSTFADLEECKEIIFTFADLVCHCFKWLRTYSVWMDGPWENLSYESVRDTLEKYDQEFQAAHKMYSTKIRQQIADGYVRRFKGQVDDPDMHNHPAPLRLCLKAQQYIKDFRPNVNIVRILGNPALLQRHWDEMSQIAGFDITPDAGTTLRKVVKLNFQAHLDKFEIISLAAMKELQLQENLHRMEAEWRAVCFETATKPGVDLLVLDHLDDIHTTLDDHLGKTLTMRGSVFVKPVDAEVKAWYHHLLRGKEITEQWFSLQTSWLKFIPVFSCPHIVAELPAETIYFHEMDQLLITFLTHITQNNNVYEIIASTYWLDILSKAQLLLDQINKGISEFIDQKRLFFPRFFFLSNTEILDILSFARNVHKLQPYFTKCFDGICTVQVDKVVITGMAGERGETIPFTHAINITDYSVWGIFFELEKQMQTSVRDEIYRSLQDYQFISRAKWLQKWPQQVILSVAKVCWTKETETCLRSGDLANLLNYQQAIVQQLQEITRLLGKQDILPSRKSVLSMLYLQELHHKCIVEDLYTHQVGDEETFEWMVQFRTVWQQQLIFQILNLTRISQYEYIGTRQRLVQTPLTERCTRALVMCYQQQLYGTLIGKGVSGKTETFRDMARSFATQYVMYNCTSGYRYDTILRLVKGIACAGAWVCFHNLDYIDSVVLSVIAQKLLNITQGIKRHAESVQIGNSLVKLKDTCFICLTINSHSGFSKLPDNLKMRFRHIFMASNDQNKFFICETILAAHGFQRAKELTSKITLFYSLLSEQLIHRKFYDFGLRALKHLLNECNSQKLMYPDEDEGEIIAKSLIKVNNPILHTIDIQLFNNYLRDFFPCTTFTENIDPQLLQALNETCTSKFELSSYLISKLQQMYALKRQNNAIILTGKAYSGKTTMIEILSVAESKLTNEKNIIEVIYPKVLSYQQLFGHFQKTLPTRWQDGICTRIFRKKHNNSKYWMVFDGPIEDAWITSLSSLLDESKNIYLQCGEVVPLPQEVAILFEVDSLEMVAPNIISSCGIVHVDVNQMSWKRIFVTWLPTANPLWCKNNENLIIDLLSWILTACLDFTHSKCAFAIRPGEMNLVKTSIALFEMLITDACINNMEDSKYVTSWIQATVFIVVIWTFSGILDTSSQMLFDEFYKSLWKNQNDRYVKPESIAKVDVVAPAEGALVDYYYIFKGKGVWKYWPDTVKSPKIEDINLQRMVVPTVDAARQTLILEMHVRYLRPFLLIGNSGCGKTRYVENIFKNKSPPTQFETSLIPITRQMDGKEAQNLFLSKLVKYKKDLYGSVADKKCIAFVDDLHVSMKDDPEKNATSELLRQYYDYGFWYGSNGSHYKMAIKDVSFSVGLGFIGGHCPNICKRFLRHFSVFVLPNICDENILKIFSCVLFHSLKDNGFPPDVMTSVQSLVQATFTIYMKVKSNLKPTPKKYLCMFNLRDFEKVINGCAMLRKDSVENKKVFPKLWIHEVLRVFGDRLNHTIDRIWLCEQLIEPLQEQFNETLLGLFDNLPPQDEKITMTSLEHLYFGTFQNENGRYEEIPDAEGLQKFAITSLERLNLREKVKLDIVIQHYSLQHFVRICRILSSPGGCGLLIGAEGSGRESLLRLAAAVFDLEVYQPKIVPKYGFDDWRQDVKHVLLQAGGRGKKIIFLIKEYHIANEKCLDDMNSLVMLSEIPNMYTVEENQEVLEVTRVAAQQGDRSLDVSISDVMSFFVNRCRQNLHIFLCFSAKNSVIRNRLRLHPAMTNICAIDWYGSWSSETFIQIANRYNATLVIPQELAPTVSKLCYAFDVVVRSMSDCLYIATRRVNRITSASYIDFLKSYKDLMNKKQAEIMQNKQKYQIGLDKLSFATEQVVLLQIELAKLKPQLIIMGQRSAAMRKEIEHETIAVEKASFLVREEEKVANVQAAAAQELKSECEADLALAIPILEDAIAALNTLKPTDITLVKSMKNPPDTIKLVMAAVCVMKEIKPDRLPDAATGRKIIDFWGPSKKILGEMNFLQQLKEFDKDDIPPPVMVKIRKEYLPNKDFQPHIVAKASSAAEGLCKWVIAMDLYDKVAKEVAPKKAKLMIAESKYATTLGILNEKRAMLSQLKDRLATLNLQLAKANADMRRVQEEVDLCTKKYKCAQRLVNSLEGEKSYWSETVNSLQTAYESLVGTMLLSAGNIAYLGPFSPEYRKQTIRKWMEHFREYDMPFSEDFDVVPTLKERGTKDQNAELNGYVISENVIILKHAKRCCLFIDPQLEINSWLKYTEAENNLQVLKVTNGDFIKQIEFSANVGHPVLIENVGETFDISLDPFLTQKTYEREEKRFMVAYGKEIELHSNFRLYLTTTLQNPKYPPHVFHKVAVIYSPITETALSEMLLDTLVEKESHILHKKRRRIVTEAIQHKMKLKSVRQNILKTLCESQSNILEDIVAIETLDSSKITLSQTLDIQLETAERQRKIEALRDQYRGPAMHGAVVYSCLLELFFLNIMYQYSLKWFTNIFQTSIETATRSKHLKVRVQNVMKNISKTVFFHVHRSLFEKDKFIFAFMLMIKTKILQNEINADIFHFFLTGCFKQEFLVDANKPAWVSNLIWKNICYLNSFEEFEGICASFRQDENPWRLYAANCKHPLPAHWARTLTSFLKLLPLKLYHPECVVREVREVIGSELGSSYITPTFYNINEAYQSSSCLNPVVILTTPGTSPIGPLIKFAQKRGLTDNFEIICLGTDEQNVAAHTLIRNRQHLEHWICLQNCHVAPDWMPTLERRCVNMNAQNTNTEFRLWLTTAPSAQFPVSILQNSTKITSDTSRGLRQGLQSCFHSDIMKNTNYYQKCPGKDKPFHKAVFGLCFFHILAQERQYFDTTKWNIPIKFDYFDLKVSLDLLAIYTNNFEEIPFKILRFLTGECIYNGKLAHEWEKKTFLNILTDIFDRNLIVDERFTLCPGNNAYRLPRKLEYYDIIHHLENMPLDHPADIYRLNANADTARNTQEFTNFLHNIQAMTSNLPLKDAHDYDVQMATQILANLPPKFDIKRIQVEFAASYERPFNNCLENEAHYYNNLLSAMIEDVTDLKNALNGNILITPKLERLLQNLSNQTVPEKWLHLSQGAIKIRLGRFLQTTSKRIEFFANWLECGQPHNFWLPAFISPKQFLVTLRQQYARTSRIPILNVHLEFDVVCTENGAESIDPVSISGLFMFGAQWDAHIGALNEPTKGPTHVPFPKISITPTNNLPLIENRYTCPILHTNYKDVAHVIDTEQIGEILLTSLRPSEYWTQRNVYLEGHLNDA